MYICMYVYHARVYCRWRSEVGTESLGSRVRMVVGCHVVLETESGSSVGETKALNH